MRARAGSVTGRRRSRWGALRLIAPCLAALCIASLGACDDTASDAPPDARPPDAMADAAGQADAARSPDASTTADEGPTADGPAPPESDFELTLGLGTQRFTPADHGAVALLQRGCQGAQHVWISLRSPALQPGPYLMTLSARRVDGQEAVPAHQLEFDWLAAPDGGAELVGVQLVIFDPLTVVDAEVDVFAEVPTDDGQVGRAVRRLRVEWGPDDC